MNFFEEVRTVNYLNDPHFDVDEAQLDHFELGAAKRQRYLLWKERLNEIVNANIYLSHFPGK